MPGDVVGADARPGMPPALRPLLSAQVLAGPELPPRRLLELLREVEDEEPLLGVEFSEELQRVNVQVMGEVQLEVLQAVLRERYGAEVSFGPCGVLYRETIANAVVGCGHFEPQYRGGCRPFRAAAPLCRGTPAPFAGRAGKRYNV